MKFNPATNRLYTDDGRLLKALHCPRRLHWEQLHSGPGGLDDLRTCAVCNQEVLDTAFLSEEALVQRLSSNPGTCLKVGLFQENVTLVHHDPPQP